MADDDHDPGTGSTVVHGPWGEGDDHIGPPAVPDFSPANPPPDTTPESEELSGGERPHIPAVPTPLSPAAVLASTGIGDADEPDDDEFEDGEGEYEHPRSLADQISDFLEFRIDRARERHLNEMPYRAAEMARKTALLEARTAAEVALMEQNAKFHQAVMKARGDKAAARGKADADRAKSSAGLGADKGRSKSGGGGGGARGGGLGRGGGKSPSGGGSKSNRSGSGSGAGGSKTTPKNGTGRGGGGRAGGGGPDRVGKGGKGTFDGRGGVGRGGGKSSTGSGGSAGPRTPGQERARGRQKRRTERQKARLEDRTKNRDQQRRQRQAEWEKRQADDAEREAKKTETAARDKEEQEKKKVPDDGASPKRITLAKATGDALEERWNKRRAAAERARAAKAEAAKATEKVDLTKAPKNETPKKVDLTKAPKNETPKKVDLTKPPKPAEPRSGEAPKVDLTKPDTGSKGTDTGKSTGPGPGGDPAAEKPKPDPDPGDPQASKPDAGPGTPDADPQGPGHREDGPRTKWERSFKAFRDHRARKREQPRARTERDQAAGQQPIPAHTVGITLERDDPPAPSTAADKETSAARRSIPSLPPATAPHTAGSGTSTPLEEEKTVSHPAAKPQGPVAPMAAQHRTNITFEEYLIEVVNLAVAAACDKEEAEELSEALAKVSDALREMERELAVDHNIDSRVTALIANLADSADRMRSFADRFAKACETASDAATLAAFSVGRTYSEDLAAMEAGGLKTASAAAHHD
ncbi:ATP/GTP-binding protein [Streptomyces sp. N35]|uniref:ATP/GTP-binding protein n=1 Tax=Streptomyces sp. N35 TaxID=2795730 RepID=UPI0018F421F7|nr:ATP/GTP-binding protein [Streptomyces sp. N35]